MAAAAGRRRGGAPPGNTDDEDEAGEIQFNLPDPGGVPPPVDQDRIDIEDVGADMAADRPADPQAELPPAHPFPLLAEIRNRGRILNPLELDFHAPQDLDLGRRLRPRRVVAEPMGEPAPAAAHLPAAEQGPPPLVIIPPVEVGRLPVAVPPAGAQGPRGVVLPPAGARRNPALAMARVLLPPPGGALPGQPPAGLPPVVVLPAPAGPALIPVIPHQVMAPVVPIIVPPAAPLAAGRAAVVVQQPAAAAPQIPGVADPNFLIMADLMQQQLEAFRERQEPVPAMKDE